MNASTIRPVVGLRLSRNAAIVLVVVALHVSFVLALQSGLLIRSAEIVVPIELLAQMTEPSLPKPALPKPTPPTPPTPLQTPLPQPPTAQVKQATSKAPSIAAPLPPAIADPTPAPNAPTGTSAAQPAPASVAAPLTAGPVSQTAAAAVQLPSSDADYLQNPKPAFPAISRRLNEQGKTTVRVLIGADGQPQRAEIGKSSGFPRLDDAALATVMRWRYVPGKRGGIAEAMWFDVPLNWVIE